MATLIIRVEFDAPGGEDLAAHMRLPVEHAVQAVLLERLSDAERDGTGVMGEVVDDEGDPI